MGAGDGESNLPINKKLVHIPLSSSATVDGDTFLQGELTLPSVYTKPKALIIFALYPHILFIKR